MADSSITDKASVSNSRCARLLPVSIPCCNMPCAISCCYKFFWHLSAPKVLPVIFTNCHAFCVQPVSYTHLAHGWLSSSSFSVLTWCITNAEVSFPHHSHRFACLLYTSTSIRSAFCLFRMGTYSRPCVLASVASSLICAVGMLKNLNGRCSRSMRTSLVLPWVFFWSFSTA